MPDAMTRQRVMALARRSWAHPLGLQAGWIVRELSKRWAPRQLPRTVVMARRADATDEQWAYVREQLRIGTDELATYGVDVCVDWTASTAIIAVGAGEHGYQLSLDG
jgi:hypothetical protein